MKVCNRCTTDKDDSCFYPKTSICKECRKDNPSQQSEYKKATQLRIRYGLTVQQYDAMIELQANLCGMCGEEFTGTPYVDHNHTCCPGQKTCGGCIRGLLCRQCNIYLGWLENKAVRKQAERYLAKYE